MPHLHLPARTITPQAAAWLFHTRQAGILNISRSACNLINARGEIVSVVTRKIGPGPFTIVLAEFQLDFSERLTAAAIQVHPDRLLLGNLDLDLCAARLWSPQPDWEGLRQRLFLHPDFQLSLAALAAWLQPRAPSGSLLEILPLLLSSGFCCRETGSRGDERDPPILTHLLLATRKPASNLCAAIAAADPRACADAAAALAGLGSGLTPAGDDFLLGASLAARLFLAPEMAGPILKAVFEAASPRTSPLSAAFLAAAARGEASAHWHTFLENLASGRDFAVRIAVGRILRAGHTSGADALAGFLAVSGRMTAQWSA